ADHAGNGARGWNRGLYADEMEPCTIGFCRMEPRKPRTTSRWSSDLSDIAIGACGRTTNNCTQFPIFYKGHDSFGVANCIRSCEKCHPTTDMWFARRELLVRCLPC